MSSWIKNPSLVPSFIVCCAACCWLDWLCPVTPAPDPEPDPSALDPDTIPLLLLLELSEKSDLRFSIKTELSSPSKWKKIQLQLLNFCKSLDFMLMMDLKNPECIQLYNYWAFRFWWPDKHKSVTWNFYSRLHFYWKDGFKTSNSEPHSAIVFFWKFLVFENVKPKNVLFLTKLTSHKGNIFVALLLVLIQLMLATPFKSIYWSLLKFSNYRN